MRRAAAALVAGAALLAGCATSPAKPGQEKAGYNRRELDDPRPGLLSGSDGAWTIYRNDAPPPPPEPPKARNTTTLLCAPGATCDPPPSEP